MELSVRNNPRSTRPESAPDFRPLYVQIRDLLVARLASGHWRAGELLPSEPRLAAEFGVSPGTVRKALDHLADQHVVVRRQGKGTYVATYTPDRALFHFFHLVGDDGERRLPESRVTSVREGVADRAERARLRLGAGAPVVRIRRTRSLDGVPALVERIVVPAELFPGLDARRSDDLPNTLYALYESEYGTPITEAEERLRAVAAEAADARVLGVEPGAPLLEVDRLALTHDRRPVEWRVSRCDTRNRHYLNHLR